MENASATPKLISDDIWEICLRAVEEAHQEGIPFAIGGGQAVSFYTGLPRETKDLDLYILPEHRDAMIRALERAGLSDYYDRLAYDRYWIYRSFKNGVIIDAIWAMANHGAEIDADWIHRGPKTNVRGHVLSIVPPEEMIWSKLYVMQRDRCDWPDIWNLIRATAPILDWRRLLDRLGDDAALLHGALVVFQWLFPDSVPAFPDWLWPELRASQPAAARDAADRRHGLLDRRPWVCG